MLQRRWGITGQDRAGQAITPEGVMAAARAMKGLGVREARVPTGVAATIPAIGIKEKEVASVATETISL